MLSKVLLQSNDTNHKSPSPSQESIVGESDQLGLSLRLQTGNEKQEEINKLDHSNTSHIDQQRHINNKADDFSAYPPAAQNKLQRTESSPAARAGHAAATSAPQNRKARVSVRARCEAATVSSLSLSLSLSLYIYS